MPYKTRQEMKAELDKIVDGAISNSRTISSMPSNKEINAELNSSVSNAKINSSLPSNKEISAELDNNISNAINSVQDEVPPEQINNGEIPPEEMQQGEYYEDPNAMGMDNYDFAQQPAEIEPRTNSADINDNIRNEHLYDLLIKLDSTSEKFADIFDNFPEDQLTFNQMVEIRRIQKEHYDYKSKLTKYLKDYFMDRTYNENLITYLHLRKALVELISKLKSVASI